MSEENDLEEEHPEHQHREVEYPCGCCWDDYSPDGVAWRGWKGYLCKVHNDGFKEFYTAGTQADRRCADAGEGVDWMPWRPKPGLETWLCRIGIHTLCWRAKRSAVEEQA